MTIQNLIRDGTFNCPNCGAFAPHRWYHGLCKEKSSEDFLSDDLTYFRTFPVFSESDIDQYTITPQENLRLEVAGNTIKEELDHLCKVPNFLVSSCRSCISVALWIDEVLIFPNLESPNVEFAEYWKYNRSKNSPVLNEKSFKCPNCNENSNQNWYSTCCSAIEFKQTSSGFTQNDNIRNLHLSRSQISHGTVNQSHFNPRLEIVKNPITNDFEEIHEIANLSLSNCISCNSAAVWIRSILVYPSINVIPIQSVPDKVGSTSKF